MKNTLKTGLKLFSTNTELISEAFELYAQGGFEYIELSVIPDSYVQTHRKWRSLDIPFIIHAPHSGNGVNLADRNLEGKNIADITEAKRFADLLACNAIIVHGGNNGSVDETVRQLKILHDDRFLLENKPMIGLHDEICIGHTPEQIGKVCQSGCVGGTVLDFGHAIYAACAMQVDAFELISAFNEFNPRIYHVADGNKAFEKDMHLNLGEGDFDLKRVFGFLSDDAMLTLETPRKPGTGLRDFIQDRRYMIKNLV